MPLAHVPECFICKRVLLGKYRRRNEHQHGKLRRIHLVSLRGNGHIIGNAIGALYLALSHCATAAR